MVFLLALAISERVFLWNYVQKWLFFEMLQKQPGPALLWCGPRIDANLRGLISAFDAETGRL